MESCLTRKKLKLLVVDRESQHCDLIRHCADILDGEFNCELQFASSGKKALSLIQSFEPNVVLIDVYMQDMTGFELLEQCCEGAAPVVITSKNCSDEIRDAAFEKGATLFVPKSDDPDEIEHQRAAW
jgi:CheY-like chemotaxis protein